MNNQAKLKKYFVVENSEEEIGSWLLLEYTNISNLVYGLYGLNSKIDFNFLISNYSFKNETDENYKVFTEKANTMFKKKVKLEKESIFITGKNFKDKICLLDMRAEKTLDSKDIENFDYFLFGGILGDHPPKDRTKALRDQGYEIRKLGVHQMPTDVAIHVSKIILEGDSTFEKINFIDDPNIPIQDLLSDPIYNLMSDFYTMELKNFNLKLKNMNEETKKLFFGDNLDKVNQMILSDFDTEIFLSSIKFNNNYYVKENNIKDFKTLNTNKFSDIYSMIGFRYLIDNKFSWKCGDVALKNFPLISPGMIKLWKNYFNESLFN